MFTPAATPAPFTAICRGVAALGNPASLNSVVKAPMCRMHQCLASQHLAATGSAGQGVMGSVDR